MRLRNGMRRPMSSSPPSSPHRLNAWSCRRASPLPATGVGLGLTTFGAGPAKRVYWTVTVMTDAAISSVTLDPASGALVKRDEVKLK